MLLADVLGADPEPILNGWSGRLAVPVRTV